MLTCSHIPQILNVHVILSSESRWVKPEGYSRVQRQLPGVEMTKVEVHMAT